jgi:hypothetical protein
MPTLAREHCEVATARWHGAWQELGYEVQGRQGYSTVQRKGKWGNIRRKAPMLNMERQSFHWERGIETRGPSYMFLETFFSWPRVRMPIEPGREAILQDSLLGFVMAERSSNSLICLFFLRSKSSEMCCTNDVGVLLHGGRICARESV